MHRRDALKVLLVALGSAPTFAATTVSTLIGSGKPGFSDQDVNNPYGLLIGPDRAPISAIWTINASGGPI